jgi:TonB family protein
VAPDWTFWNRALLFGAVKRSLPYIARYTVLLSVILILALLLIPATLAQGPSQEPAAPQANEQTFAALVQQLAAELQPQGVKRVLILDLEDPDAKVTPFGAWLADQFALANTWTPIQIVDRKDYAAQTGALRSSEANGWDAKKVDKIAKAHNAIAVAGSYSAGENGIGVTLEASGKGKSLRKSVRGKIAMTGEMKSHLTVPLESLLPADGVFSASQAGVGLPTCVYCPNPNFTEAAVARRAQGEILLVAVITPEGKASAIVLKKKLDKDLDQAAIDAVKGWTFKPATNVDGKPVAVRVPIEVTFRLFK